MDGLRDSVTMTVATVRGERCRIKGGVVELAVVVKPHPAHASPRGVHPAKFRWGLRDDLPDPRRPGTDVAGKPTEVVHGVVELAVQVDALLAAALTRS